jgi:6-pyruvoyltetrahydropterin/6-carboxytetrahydropterin synthase
MFSVTLVRPLTSKHFFPDLEGEENEVHFHHYRVEVTLQGAHLDDCGFLVNVDTIVLLLEKELRRFEGKLLNRMREFRSIPPSMENLAKVIWSKMAQDIDQSCVELIKVTVWEEDGVRASFESMTDERLKRSATSSAPS